MSWDSKLLGEVVDLTQGFCINKKSNHLVVDEGIPLLRITDMINSQQKIFISPEIPKKFIANKDDIIFTRTGQVGLVFRNQYGIIHNNCFTVSPLNQELSKDYLYWFLRSEETITKAKGLAAGAAQPDLNHGAFKSISITYPQSLQTQKRIADILSAYDDLIENNLKRIKLLEQAAQNIYKEWFVNLRFPGHENTAINEETGLPVGWEEKMFNDVSVNNNRKRIPVNGTDRSKRQGNYRYYGATGVMDYIDDYIFDGRFLLIAEDGTVYDKIGNAYTQLVQGKFWVNNHAHIISAGSLPVEYLYLAMKHYPIGHLITGAVQLKLSMKNLKRVEIINPSEEILDQFMSIINPMINQVFILTAQNHKLKAARDILLPRLMNRTIEV